MGGKIMRRNEGRDGGLDAPDAADVFSDLVRVRTLELGELRGAFDLEEYLIPVGRDDLWIETGNPDSAPVSPAIMYARTFTLIGWFSPVSPFSGFTSGGWDVACVSICNSKCDGVTSIGR